MRALNFILLCTSFIALILVYGQKYRSEDVQSQVIDYQREIATQQQVLKQLDADWAYLNQPGRLQAIVERNAETLGLEPIKVSQYGSIDQLPLRPTQPDAAGLGALISALESGLDPSELEGIADNE